jgi:hypothetical protein
MFPIWKDEAPTDARVLPLAKVWSRLVENLKKGSKRTVYEIEAEPTQPTTTGASALSPV